MERVNLGITLPIDFNRLTREIAQIERRSVSNLILVALEDYISRHYPGAIEKLATVN